MGSDREEGTRQGGRDSAGRKGGREREGRKGKGRRERERAGFFLVNGSLKDRSYGIYDR